MKQSTKEQTESERTNPSAKEQKKSDTGVRPKEAEHKGANNNSGHRRPTEAEHKCMQYIYIHRKQVFT